MASGTPGTHADVPGCCCLCFFFRFDFDFFVFSSFFLAFFKNWLFETEMLSRPRGFNENRSLSHLNKNVLPKNNFFFGEMMCIMGIIKFEWVFT